MSVRNHRGGWETRWRDASGRSRSKRFKSEEAALAYDEAVRDVSPAARRPDTARGGSGVYSYITREGIRWRFVVRRSDGSQTSKRGSPASGPRPTHADDSSSRSSAARASTPPRPSAATGNTGSPAAVPTSRRAPGAAMRSTAVNDCCLPLPMHGSERSRSTTSARSSPTSSAAPSASATRHVW